MKHHLEQTLLAAKANHHRALIVCTGSESFVLESAQALVDLSSFSQGLWVGHQPVERLPQIEANKTKSWLGRELDIVVFNAFSGFDVNAFGAVSGALKGGGLMLLLIPELDGWYKYADPEHKRLAVYPVESSDVSGLYLKRLAHLISGSEYLSLISENFEDRWRVASVNEQQEAAPENPENKNVYFTEDQRIAIESVVRVAKGHRRRPLVLTADRGRGKSAALGIAAAQLLQAGLNHISVTAPSLASVEVLFKHAKAILENAELTRGFLCWEDKVIQFFPPDELAQNGESPKTDLMLVDEAAAIPVPLLYQLLKDHSRIVFASTIHGYEGTGRGFAVKFRKHLDQITPKWRALHSQQAIRWRENDPLEQFVFDALLLNADPVSDDLLAEASVEGCDFVKVERQHLIDNEPLLRELFGLLVIAHYQTSPFDLRHLMDGPNIELFMLTYQGHVVGAVLVALEGDIDASLEEKIWSGKRRVRGHLLPQSLSNHVGIPEAIGYKGYRILRIAVHPALQNQGLGKCMLSKLSDEAERQALDYLGSSFGATTELLRFWGDSEYSPVRTGLVREASSGCFSAMVIKPLSEPFAGIAKEAVERAFESLLMMLPETLQQMETELVLVLLQYGSKGFDHGTSTLTARDKQDVKSFTESDRLYESCVIGIRKLLLECIGKPGVQDELLLPLIAKQLQYHSWDSLAKDFHQTGRKQVVELLRRCVRKLIL